MGLDDFMDVLGKLNRLTPAQKRVVSEVLAEGADEATAALDKSHSAKRKSRPHYTPEERLRLRFYASNWYALTNAKQQAALSSFHNRTESQVYRMIHKYRTGK